MAKTKTAKNEIKVVDAMTSVETVPETPEEELLAIAKMHRRWEERTLADKAYDVLRAAEMYAEAVVENAKIMRARYEALNGKVVDALNDKEFYQGVNRVASNFRTMGRYAEEWETASDKFRTVIVGYDLVISQLSPKTAPDAETDTQN